VVVYGGSVGVSERREIWVVLFICVWRDWAVWCICICMGKDRCVCVVEKDVCNCVYRCWG